jgi:hypothetical protein
MQLSFPRGMPPGALAGRQWPRLPPPIQGGKDFAQKSAAAAHEAKDINDCPGQNRDIVGLSGTPTISRISPPPRVCQGAVSELAKAGARPGQVRKRPVRPGNWSPAAWQARPGKARQRTAVIWQGGRARPCKARSGPAAAARRVAHGWLARWTTPGKERQCPAEAPPRTCRLPFCFCAALVLASIVKGQQHSSSIRRKTLDIQGCLRKQPCMSRMASNGLACSNGRMGSCLADEEANANTVASLLVASLCRALTH